MKEDNTETRLIRTIIRTPEFDLFYNFLTPKVQTKIDYVINIIATVYNVPTKFIKHIESSDLYEMRVSIGTNEYRTILFAIDHSNIIEAKNILLLNSFLKKSSKDYKKQIDIAEAILNRIEL
jgi:phage-related protein